MEIAAIICFVIATLISLIYGFILLIRAFQAGILWGLGYIFVPFVALIFIIVHWDDAKSPFLKSLLCIPFYIAAIVLMPNSGLAQF